MARARLLSVTLACALVAPGCFLFDRENPRLTKAVRTTGDLVESITITYDDAAYPTKVVIKEAIATQTLALSWQGGVIESVAIEKDPDNEAFPTEKSLVRLTWEDGRVASAKETFEDSNTEDNLEAPVTNSTLRYDDGGRIEKLEGSTVANGAAVRDVTDFLYDDGGNLTTIDSTLRVMVGTEETSRAITEREIEVEGGRPTAITFRNAGNVTQVDVDEDDQGRVDEFDVTYTSADDPENERRALVGFSYRQESGLLSAMTVSDDDGPTDDPLTELEYDDGEAAGVDVTPYSIFLYGLWDLKGKSHLGIDPRTQGARLVLPVW